MRRFWRRTDTPKPWWPWGILPAIGLAALFLFGAMITAPAIQADVRSSVSRELEKAGVPATEITADGQQVTARVGAAGPGEVYLEGLARSARCDTWAGSLTCPTAVALVVDPPEAAPAVAITRPQPFDVLREADSVILRGEVPNTEERNRIVGLAGGYFDKVDDRLQVSNEPAGANYAPAADGAIAVASRLVRGQASWSGEQLSVSGIARPEDIATARAEFDAAGGPGMLGTFAVETLDTPADALQLCNEAFDNALSDATIRFRTGSAEIETGNELLLESLASLARDCPGVLTVEGHTDSLGDADMNQALSLARASAVRDALSALGIETQRIRAVGLGESQPIADNSTPEGRARNRRIVIAVDAID